MPVTTPRKPSRATVAGLAALLLTSSGRSCGACFTRLPVARSPFQSTRITATPLPSRLRSSLPLVAAVSAGHPRVARGPARASPSLCSSLARSARPEAAPAYRAPDRDSTTESRFRTSALASSRVKRMRSADELRPSAMPKIAEAIFELLRTRAERVSWRTRRARPLRGSRTTQASQADRRETEERSESRSPTWFEKARRARSFRHAANRLRRFSSTAEGFGGVLVRTVFSPNHPDSRTRFRLS
jgi:hypothetical protein